MPRGRATRRGATISHENGVCYGGGLVGDLIEESLGKDTVGFWLVYIPSLMSFSFYMMSLAGIV